MHPLVNIGIKAARKAGRIILNYRDRIDSIQVNEKQKNDFVTEVDHAAEAIIVETIHKSYPDHSILAEERGEVKGENEITWIIDPLDGTRNYVHGFPQYAVSIAVREKGIIQHGVVFDPLLDDIYAASRGGGARLNDRRIRVANRKDLSQCLIATGFPYRDKDQIPWYIKRFEVMMKQCGGIRRAGSAALDLAYVAAGRVDGFWENGLAPWDIAAGTLLVMEAGGFVGDTEGKNDYLTNGNVVAGNERVYKGILDILQQADK